MTFTPEFGHRNESQLAEKQKASEALVLSQNTQIVKNHDQLVNSLNNGESVILRNANFRDFKTLLDAGREIIRTTIDNKEPFYITNISYQHLSGYGGYTDIQSVGLVIEARLQKKEETKSILYLNDKFGERNLQTSHYVVPMNGLKGLWRSQLKTSISIEEIVNGEMKTKGGFGVYLPQMKSEIRGFKIYQGNLEIKGNSGIKVARAGVADLDVITAFERWQDEFHDVIKSNLGLENIEQIKKLFDTQRYGLLLARLNSIQEDLAYYESKRNGTYWTQYIRNAVNLAGNKLAAKRKEKSGGDMDKSESDGGKKPVGPMAANDPDTLEFKLGESKPPLPVNYQDAQRIRPSSKNRGR